MRDPARVAAYTAKAQEHIDAFFADGRTLPYDYVSGPVTARIHAVGITAIGDLRVVVGLFVNGQEITCPDRAGPTGKCQIWVATNPPLLVQDPAGAIERTVVMDGVETTVTYSADPLTIQRGGLTRDIIGPILGAI